MKCEYCGREDHLITACSRKTGCRRFEVILAVVIIITLIPFCIIGILFGVVMSALVAGYKMTNTVWNETIEKLHGKNDEPTAI